MACWLHGIRGQLRPAGDSRHDSDASDSSTEDEDLDAAVEGISLERNSSISRSLGRGRSADFGLPAAATRQLPAGTDSAAAPRAAASPGGVDSRNFRFQPPLGIPGSMPISAMGSGRPLRTASDLGYMMQQSGLTTESKMVRVSPLCP